MRPPTVSLQQMVSAMEQIAPLEYAEEWDNTGLIIEPSRPSPVHHLMLTIDLTEAVLTEAVRLRCQAIVAYHPPLFEPIKKITTSVTSGRIAVGAIHHGMAVYSPHTALDNVEGGINDWIAKGLGTGEVRPIFPVARPDSSGPSLANPGNVAQVQAGTGRTLRLKQPISEATLIKRVKKQFKLNDVRTSAPIRRTIKTVAICAGAGSSVIRKSSADVLLTGEMRHHDILEAQARGKLVVLCEHTHTERGYLPLLKKRLQQALSRGIKISISKKDTEPLRIG